MNNKTFKIKMDINNPNEKNIKLNIDNTINELNFLTLKLTQEDVYQSTNSDFGVVVGRVIANNGIGVPNAKLSIFIPLKDVDLDKPDILSIYPYTSPLDVDDNGKRYNLLPRTSSLDENNNYKPKQPFGTFPNKEEILTNDSYLYVYKNYYKYTTTTNEYGDYMLFGVPVGLQKLHMSVDITDIGKNSMSPLYMINNLGYSPNLFTEDGVNIIEQERLSDLPNIETQDIDVNVIPFWGDVDIFEIGITRQDFNIRALLKSSAIIFGTIGTMGEPCIIGSPIFDRKNNGFNYLSPDSVDIQNNMMNHDIRTLRGSNNIKFSLYTYTQDVDMNDVTYDLNLSDDLSIDEYNSYKKIEVKNNLIKLDESEYFTYVENGFFSIVVNCNRRRVIIDENGDEVVIGEDDNRGVYSRFYGMMLVSCDDDELSMRAHNSTYYGKDTPINSRGMLKIPQEDFSLRQDEFSNSKHYIECDKWRKTFFTLQYNKFYSIAQFFPTRHINDDYYTNKIDDNKLGLDDNILTISGLIFRVKGVDIMNNYQYKYDNNNTVIKKPDILLPDDIDSPFIEYDYQFPYNKSGVIKTVEYEIDGVLYSKDVEQKYFGGQWINMFAILPQYSYTSDYTRSERLNMVSSYITGDYDDNDTNYNSNRINAYFLPHRENQQIVFDGETNTTNILRGDVFKTSIINVPIEHISIFRDVKEKYVNSDNEIFELYTRRIHFMKLVDEGIIEYDSQSSNEAPYRYDLPNNTSNDTQFNTAYDDNLDNNKGPYIFKGFYKNDCIKKLYELNFI